MNKRTTLTLNLLTIALCSGSAFGMQKTATRLVRACPTRSFSTLATAQTRATGAARVSPRVVPVATTPARRSFSSGAYKTGGLAALLAGASVAATGDDKELTEEQPSRLWSTWNRPWDENEAPPQESLLIRKNVPSAELSPADQAETLELRKKIAERLERDFSELYEAEQQKASIEQWLKQHFSDLGNADIQRWYKQWKVEEEAKRGREQYKNIVDSAVAYYKQKISEADARDFLGLKSDATREEISDASQKFVKRSSTKAERERVNNAAMLLDALAEQRAIKSAPEGKKRTSVSPFFPPY